MSETEKPPAARPSQEAIAKRAYELFLQRGSVSGYEPEDWLGGPAALPARGGGQIRVGARRADVAPAAPAAAPRTIAIVGAGAAGDAAAGRLRREGYAGDIRLFGADVAPPVDRPNLSKDYLAGTAPEEWL